MLDIDTPFRREVRSLSAPNSPKFDPAKWQKLARDIALIDADKALLQTAFWLARESKAIRAAFDGDLRPPLSARLAMTLAIATLNRDSATLVEKSRKAQEAARKKGTISEDQLADLAVSLGDNTTKLDPSSYADAITDTIDSWLHEAADSAGELGEYARLADEAAGNATRHSFGRGQYDLWQTALWEGWELVEDDQPLFMPASHELAALLDACVMRHQSDFLAGARKLGAQWAQMGPEERRDIMLPLTVTAIDEKPGRRRQFFVKRPPPVPHAPAYVIEKSALEESYLAPLLDRPLPAMGEVNCGLVLRAWHVIQDLAKLLVHRLPRASFHNTGNVRQWALAVRRNELLEVLHQALSVPDDGAQKILDFLSWKKDSYKGLWGAPLVPLPGGDDLVLAQPVLETSDVIRRVEIWLTKGGLDDNLSQGSRGSTYEAHLRLKIREVLKGNPIVKDSACADQAIKKTADFGEEIDLLIQFDSLLLVGEVKSLLFPSDSRERYNFMVKLKDAAAQASRKAAYLAHRRKAAAYALKITETRAESLRIVPIVVMNQGFGASLRFADCIVTDAAFLMQYLGTGKYYENAADAVQGFATTMQRPPPLYRFVDGLRWTEYEFPMASGGAFRIARTEFSESISAGQ